MDIAVAREKQLKAGSRKKKVALIEENNPSWEDLYTPHGLIPIPHCEEHSDEAI